MKKQPTRTQKGFSTIELLIAFAVAIIFISSAMMVAFGGQAAGLDTKLDSHGFHRAMTQIGDAARDLAVSWDIDPAPHTDTDTDTYAFKYTRANSEPLSFGEGSCAKLVIATTTWNSEHNRSNAMSFSTIVSDMASAQQSPYCDPTPPTQWDNPSDFGSIDVSGSAGTGVAVTSINGTRYAFVTSAPSAPAGKDFLAFAVSIDLNNPTNPVQANPTTPGIDTGPGLNGIAIGDGFAYVLNNDNTNQLQVIDIETNGPDNPTLVTSVTLHNINYTCSPASKPCKAGKSIAYYDGYVFIGTNYLAFGAPGENEEFQVFCVSNTSVPTCAPSAPVFMDSVNIGHNINDIAISGHRAYIATSDDTGELMAIDISDPANLSNPNSAPTTKFDAAGTEDGWSIDAHGGRAYLGRDRVNQASESEFYVLNVTNPTNIVKEGEEDLPVGPGSYASSLIVRGNFAFLATTDSNEPLFVLDISNESDPQVYGACGLNYSQVTRDMAFSDNLLITANRSNDLLRIIYDPPLPNVSCS